MQKLLFLVFMLFLFRHIVMRRWIAPVVELLLDMIIRLQITILTILRRMDPLLH